MSILEIIKIVAKTTVIVVILCIVLKKAKSVLRQRAVRKSLEKEKIMSVTGITGFCRFMLWSSTVLNVMGFISLLFTWILRGGIFLVFSPVAGIFGIISFITALILLIIIYRQHITEWKSLAIFNLVAGLFLLLYNFMMFGILLWGFSNTNDSWLS